MKTVLLQKSGLLKALLLLVSLLTLTPSVKADGSRDMFPEGGKGYRASLWSSYDCINETNPFPTLGVMKVYAKPGEFILLGSSTIGKFDSEDPSKGKGAIIYRAPNGATETFDDKSVGGRIDNRKQELAGPNYNGTITDGFKPISIEVGEDQEGVWEVYFLSPTYKYTYNSDDNTTKYKLENWSQNNNDGTVMAFDISVCNAEKTALIPGRAYTNVLNMVSLAEPEGVSYASSWYSNLYVLTEVGYTYRINTNGQNPHYGTFFSNNKGLQKPGTGNISTNEYVDPIANKATGYKSYENGEELYKSWKYTTGSETGYIYDPRLQDNRELVTYANGETAWKYNDVTHKIFFTKPAADLPESAKAVYGTTITDTWLKNPATKTPKMENLAISGLESGRKGLVGPEGAAITFTSGVSGSFTIKMKFPEGYTERQLKGACVRGENSISWDGKDGDGTAVKLGVGTVITLSGTINAGEVHFPFVDLENNENGFILELIDNEENAISDIIYWDDSDVQTDETGTDGISSLTGTASATGAHKWTKENSSGDKTIIDTWSYVRVSSGEVNVEPKIQIVDLTISEAKTMTETAAVGQEITYQLKVENLNKTGVEFGGQTVDLNCNADSAAIGVWLETGGFHVTSISIVESDDENCKVLSQPNGDVNSVGYITLANGKSATVLVSGYADATIAGSAIQPKAFVMRPGDVYEIDAENLADDGMPSDPTAEYAGTNNNLVTCDAVTINPNGKPVIDDENTEDLNVTIKAENGKSYAENPIMLPVAIYDPENTPVTVTISGDDAALFKVEGANIFYIGTTPAEGENVVYNITTTAVDENGATTVRNIAVNVVMNDGTLNDSNINVETVAIKYGQKLEDAITKMETSDVNGADEANGSWIIRKEDGSIVTKDDILDAGTYNLTFSYYTENVSDFGSSVVTKTVEVSPRTITIASEGKTKEYDGTELKNEVVTVAGDGFVGTDDITTSNFTTLKNADEVDNKFDVTFNAGTKASNYVIEPTYGKLKVTPKVLSVDGATSNPKEFDNNTDATLKTYGTLTGVLEGEDVSIDEENTVAKFEDPEVGTEKNVNITYALKGEDAKNYTVEDPFVINDGVITAAVSPWTITKNDVPYGDAKVGDNEKAEYDNAPEGATYSYEVDGNPASEGDILPAGPHTIKVTLKDAEDNKIDDVTFTCNVDKKVLTVEGAASNPKEFDNNTDATLDNYGTLTGMLEGDKVEIDEENTVAKFEDPEVGTDKNVDITYALKGDDADNYTVNNPVVINDGVITSPWAITKNDVPYGDAKVGDNEKAEYNNVPEGATYSYEVDGNPASEGDILPAGPHTIKVTLKDAEDNKIDDVTFTCNVDKKVLTVEGAASNPKEFDNNTDATLDNYGTLTGMLEGDKVEIDEENTVAKFEDPEVGTDKNVDITYTLKGEDADNYTVNNPVVINDGVITETSSPWTITKNDVPYGDAKVGDNEKAEYNNVPEGATYSYEVDGNPASEGDILPAGPHTIKVTLKDAEDNKIDDVTFTCNVDKKVLTVEGAASNPKEFDNNTDATLDNYGTLTGMLEGDKVEIDEENTVAKFEDPEVGTEKNVDIT
ncbi:MAG: YDG domain-containing protein, partial [Paludibacteraceae bacterium]|nr:YDG domain-containing protein [Paludibacteraceae bacterium]